MSDFGTKLHLKMDMGSQNWNIEFILTNQSENSYSCQSAPALPSLSHLAYVFNCPHLHCA